MNDLSARRCKRISLRRKQEGVAWLTDSYIVRATRFLEESALALPNESMPMRSSCAYSPFCSSLNQSNSEGFPIVARLAVAVGLMLLFLVVSINVSPLVPGTRWWQFWPLAFMIVGLFLMIMPVKSKFEALWHAIGILITSAAALLLPIVLEIAPPDSISDAFATLWPLAVMALVIFVIGIATKKGLVVITGSVLFAMFCLLTLYLFALP